MLPVSEILSTRSGVLWDITEVKASVWDSPYLTEGVCNIIITMACNSGGS